MNAMVVVVDETLAAWPALLPRAKASRKLPRST